MKLKVIGVICSGCGGPAPKIAGKKEHSDVFMGSFRLCRCWHCLVDYLILYDDSGNLITVMPDYSTENFMYSAGSKKPEWWEDIPF